MRLVYLLCTLVVFACDSKTHKTAPVAVPDPPKRSEVASGDALPFSPISVEGVLDEAHADTPLITVTDAAISVNGAVVANIVDGKVAEGQLQESALGYVIPTLTAAINKLPKPASVRLLVHSEAAFGPLFQSIMSVHGAGIQAFELVATSKGKPGAISLHLPNYEDLDPPCEEAIITGHEGAMGEFADKEEPPSGAPSATRLRPCVPGKEPVQLVLSITKDQGLLWSVSGLEGTLREPKLVLSADEEQRIDNPEAVLARQRKELHAVLVPMVERRWVKEKRGKREVVFQTDVDMDARTVFFWIAALRYDADGKPLFTNVLLSAGYQ